MQEVKGDISKQANQSGCKCKRGHTKWVKASCRKVEGWLGLNGEGGLVLDVEGGVGFDGGEGGGGGGQLSSRKSRRCPAISRQCLPVRYPRTWHLYYHPANSDL